MAYKEPARLVPRTPARVRLCVDYIREHAEECGVTVAVASKAERDQILAALSPFERLHVDFSWSVMDIPDIDGDGEFAVWASTKAPVQ